MKEFLFAAIEITKSDLHLDDAPDKIDQSSLQAILGTAYMWAGIIAVIVIIIGGLRYITGNGSPDKIKSAKHTIIFAVIGLLVVVMAAAITQFLVENVAKG